MVVRFAPIAFTFTLTLISSQAFSQAITIQSVNVEMTAQEFTSSLVLSGHTCTASVFNDTGGVPITNLVTCKSMNNGTPAEIKHSENLTSGSRQIYFDCGALNSCGYSLEQVGQAIVDSGFVSNLDPRDEFNPEFSFYWGRGMSGDEIEIHSTMTPGFSGYFGYLSLSTGALGNGGIKLN